MNFMRRATKPLTNGKKSKTHLPARSQALLARIRERRERIRRRVGVLPNSAELIRQDRER
jgi:hypothetical protein